MSKQSFTQAYNALIDWNAKYVDAPYEQAPATLLDALLNVIPSEWNPDDGYWLTSYLHFCPKCGCLDNATTDNMATYPEQFYKTVCTHCGFVLGMVDNSPYCAWYQYKDNDFVVEI